MDGGAWIVCSSIDDSRTRFACRVFDDHIGELSAEGEFELAQWSSDETRVPCTSLTSNPTTLEYDGFDGITIYLSGGCVLDRIRVEGGN